MFDFHFVYADGFKYNVMGVTKMAITTSSGIKEISGEEILVTKIPLGSHIDLYSSDQNVSIDGSNLLIINVTFHSMPE